MPIPNRTYCDTLKEMRNILHHMTIFNFKRSQHVLQSLVEECQTYGNRMEASLYDKGDIQRMHKEKSKLEAEVNVLRSVLNKPVSRIDKMLED